MTSKPKQPIDSFTFFLMWLLGMLFLRIPNEFAVAKLLAFCLVVCAAFLCFFVSKQKAMLKEVNQKNDKRRR